MIIKKITDSEYVKRFAASFDGLSAVTGDMAQLAGAKVRRLSEEEGLTALERNMEREAAFFTSDGVLFAAGRSEYEAETAAEVVEKCIKAALRAETLGGAVYLDRADAEKLRADYIANYSAAENAFRQESERESSLRKALVDYGKKILETGLVRGTWGNLSVRLDEKYMLVTPSGMDYNRITPEHIVKVEIETLKYEGAFKPTSESPLHSAVYRTRTDASAVIHTHSDYCTAFAVARKPLLITAPELKAAAGEVADIGGPGLPGSKELTENTVRALGSNPGCIMANHGMLACGKDLVQALERCLAMEEAAKRAVGE